MRGISPANEGIELLGRRGKHFHTLYRQHVGNFRVLTALAISSKTRLTSMGGMGGTEDAPPCLDLEAGTPSWRSAPHPEGGSGESYQDGAQPSDVDIGVHQKHRADGQRHTITDRIVHHVAPPRYGTWLNSDAG